MSVNYQSKPATTLLGEIRVPGDKSISHRSILLSAIANGETRIQGFLFGADNLATMEAIRQLGVEITLDKQSLTVVVQGVGKLGLQQASQALDMGNSGTAIRLLTGLLSGQSFSSTLIGDESLTKRPMTRITRPLEQMGAKLLLTEAGTAPINIEGGAQLKGIDYPMPMASAQVKSALLLAGLYAEGETSVIEPGLTRDHTERMLRAFSYPVETKGNRIALQGGGELVATDINIPADISSAAFFMVAASITPGSTVTLLEVGLNPTRVGVINILQAMGATLEIFNHRQFGDEPVADIKISAAPLQGIDIPLDQVPLAIDEMPVIMIAAACATGITRLRDARELRVKETDRILAMATGLTELGIECSVLEDGIDIQGGQLGGGTVDSFGDHRIAMSFAVAGCVAKAPICITDCTNVQTSFPNFVLLANQLGMNLVSEG